MLPADQELRQLASRTEQLLATIEELPEIPARTTAIEAIQAIVQLYGAGLSRMTRQIEARDPALLNTIAGDELIAHLLILHDLHPIDVAARVDQALEDVRPYLQSHGGNVELVGIDGGVVQVRLAGSCHGCPSSTMTLKVAIEEAVRKRAPELDAVEAVNPTPAPPPSNRFVPLASLRSRPAAASDRPAWTSIPSPADLTSGTKAVVEVNGAMLLLVRLGETFYAYRNSCPACGDALDRGELTGALLACPSCEARFDVRQAGRSPDAPSLYLEPIPLLVADRQIQVAIPAIAGHST